MVGPGKARACAIQVPWDQRINHRISWIGTFQSKCLATCFLQQFTEYNMCIRYYGIVPRRVLRDWVEAQHQQLCFTSQRMSTATISVNIHTRTLEWLKNGKLISHCNDVQFVFKCFHDQQDSQQHEKASRKYQTRKLPNGQNVSFFFRKTSLLDLFQCTIGHTVITPNMYVQQGYSNVFASVYLSIKKVLKNVFSSRLVKVFYRLPTPYKHST